ncbi:hypothetical protein [Polymorphospora lycopeni]|uniref:Uncharacterized protein n=1 Tax=Polymorphospora lycopeni TaxID=3140240 RepID=A0ABV5CVK8_9ACTN
MCSYELRNSGDAVGTPDPLIVGPAGLDLRPDDQPVHVFPRL